MHALCAPWAVATGAEAPDSTDAISVGNATAAQLAVCAELASTRWPSLPSARRVYLQRLESARPYCIGHAPFLAALGAVWLDEGEPQQALIWLERSLLLDPDNLGAQADHALALSALGQPEALRALLSGWRGRTDVPKALHDRLAASSAALDFPSSLPAARLGGPANGGHWLSHREASLLLGYESNLDHSPRLAEITLTAPDGPIDLPLLNPLKPRRGAALLTDLSWQVARSPSAGQAWRAGLYLGARTTPGQSTTDWHQIQWAGSGSQVWGPWRGQLEVSASWIGGPLNEPYRLVRISATGERSTLGCTLRVSLEAEARDQQQTASANGRTAGTLLSAQCPVPRYGGWVWGAAIRANVDEPQSDDRPGGRQRAWNAGVRLTGLVGSSIRLDASLRAGRVRDEEGYSPLLENNAARRLSQTQLSLELARPLGLMGWTGIEAVAQIQALRQGSNLPVFRYSAVSSYGGVRWTW